MIYHLTISLNATHSWTRVNAFISYTRLIWRAVGVQSTLRSTAFVWIAVILWQTLTRSGAVLFLANCASPTRRRYARIAGWFILNRSLFDRTLNKWVTNVAVKALTDRSVTDNMTLGILATYSVCARVFTVSIDTGEMIGTLRTSYTLRSTIWSLTDEIGQTIACVTVSIHSTLGIWATWGTSARIDVIFFNRRRRLLNFSCLVEGKSV